MAETIQFEPTRLTIARQRKLLTKGQLAKSVGVTPRMVSLYEAGEKSPSSETLVRIADALGFSVEYFGKGALDTPSQDAASFRSLAKRTGYERDAALAAGALAFDFVRLLKEKRFRLPEPALPDLRGVDPETAATIVRTQWNLQRRPIANAIHELESRGVRVFSLHEPGENIDAFSLWYNDEPFIFLNTQKSAERSRHDLGHALGHLILHKHGAPQGHIAEREADAFASAFLMPREAILAGARTYPTLESLIPVKKKWKVSLASLVFRLHRLQIISDWHYHLLFTELSRLGYRKSEPEGVPREMSQVLEKVFAYLRKQGVAKHHLASELAIPVSELESLVFGLVTLTVKGSAGIESERAARFATPKLAVVRYKEQRFDCGHRFLAGGAMPRVF